MTEPLVVTWSDAVLLAALTAGVWTALGAAADRLVSEARRRPRRSGPSSGRSSGPSRSGPLGGLPGPRSPLGRATPRNPRRPTRVCGR